MSGEQLFGCCFLVSWMVPFCMAWTMFKVSIAKRIKKMKRFFQVMLVMAAGLFCCSCSGRAGESQGNGLAGEAGNSGGQESGREWQDKESARQDKEPARLKGESARQYVDTAMGTVIQQTAYASEEAAADFYDKSMTLLTGLEQEVLSWRLESSEVWRINESAGDKEGCGVSEEMWVLLQDCLELHERSGGVFDVTLGQLTRLWNIDEWAAGDADSTGGFQLPSAEDLEKGLSLCGSEKVRLVPAGSEGEIARIYLPEGMQLDLGAVGKGLAQSRLSSLLEEEERVSGAVISLGGSILTFGGKPDGSSWKVGIVNPFDTSSNVGILSLEGKWCVSTSGDYERYVEADGVRYHHILDPDTGYPAVSDVRGVTVLAKDGLLSDGLSTACFILGAERGMELAQRYGVEVLFVMSDGSIVMSDGMGAYFTAL